MKKSIIAVALVAVSALSGCATLVNDPNVPVALSFSDGSKGKCELINGRGQWATQLPETVHVRRDANPLKFECKTEKGVDATGEIEAGMDMPKILASIFLIDFGITDTITDMHREYPTQYVIKVTE